jgi:hypothetical protein
MDGSGNEGIPDSVPEGIVHPFQIAPIREDPREKRDHINQVGENAPHSYFPGPGLSIKEGEIPEKVFVRVHGMKPPERRVLIRRSKKTVMKNNPSHHGLGQ